MKDIDDNSGFFSDDLYCDDKEGRDHNEYVIGKCIYISETGFSEIYLTKKGGRLFVLKALKPEYRYDPVALALLEKEFDITFSLDMRGVSNAFDLIEHSEKGKCIVLKYYAGSNLRALMATDYKFTDKELEVIWLSVIGSVKEIHRLGIVHRDIKPSNILFNPDTSEVTLIDFGCADTYDQLHFKGLAGTPIYMPQEDAGTTAGDWYALSKVFEELCASNNAKIFRHRINSSLKRMKKGMSPFEDSISNGILRKNVRIISICLVGILLAASLLFFSSNNEERIDNSEREKAEYPAQLTSGGLSNKDSVIPTEDDKTISTKTERSDSRPRIESETTSKPTFPLPRILLN